MGRGDVQRLSDLPKVMQLVGGSTELGPRPAGLVRTLNHFCVRVSAVEAEAQEEG